MDAVTLANDIVNRLFPDRVRPTDEAAWRAAGLQNGWTDDERQLIHDSLEAWLVHVHEDWPRLRRSYELLKRDANWGIQLHGHRGDWEREYWPREWAMVERFEAWHQLMLSDPLQVEREAAAHELLQACFDTDIEGHWPTWTKFRAMVQEVLWERQRQNDQRFGPRPDW